MRRTQDVWMLMVHAGSWNMAGPVSIMLVILRFVYILNNTQSVQARRFAVLRLVILILVLGLLLIFLFFLFLLLFLVLLGFFLMALAF
jgi:hypothetical protein